MATSSGTNAVVVKRVYYILRNNLLSQGGNDLLLEGIGVMESKIYVTKVVSLIKRVQQLPDVETTPFRKGINVQKREHDENANDAVFTRCIHFVCALVTTSQNIHNKW